LAAPEPTPPKLSPESNGRSIGGASLAKSSGLYKSSLAASEFGGGSYRPGVVMVSPAELAMALDEDEDEEYAEDDDDDEDDDDEDDDIVFDRTLTNTSVASRLSRLTGVGEYFEMTPVEFDARIVLLEPLGQGAYGVVYRAALVNPASTDVAVKLLHRGGVGATNEQLAEFRREIDMLRGLDHPRIVKVLGACVQPPRMSIVQEFVDGGSLHEVLHNSQYDTVHDGANFGSEGSSFGSEGSHGRVTKSKISFRAQLTVAVDIADAVDYLHNVCDPKVIHRDLKPQNVLVDVRGRAKLADFGIARRFRSTFLDTKNHAMGTLNYMAPCLFGDGKDVDISCDAYSFAMIAYEMFTGEEPWKTLSAMQIAMTVGVEGRRPKLPDSCPSDYAALIHACWSQDPNDRPDFRDVKRDLRDLREQVVWDDAVTAAGGKPARRERSMTLREADAMNARLKVLREYRGSHESRSSQEDSSLILYEGTGEKARDATPVIGSDSSVVLTVSESTPSESIELESVAEH
jgi:serine/threonine protein kinase